jgi:hypothetical protein
MAKVEKLSWNLLLLMLIFYNGLLLENKIKISYELYNLYEEEKQINEVKILSDKIDEALLDLDKYSSNELINIFNSFSSHFNSSIHETYKSSVHK